jgi:predicted ATPase/tetratricopeptide (TPR) repeat protein
MTNPSPSSFVSFGELLKHLRHRARLTQTELGISVGYSPGHVARLEAGQRQPDVASVKAQFVAALGLESEPEWAARLVSLAERACGSNLPAPAASATSPSPTNLLAPLTSFVGREREIAEVTQLLGTTRLLTLTGAGGAGKTRLALEVGASFRAAGAPEPSFREGVWLADLAPLADPALVAATVAGVFDLHPSMRPALVMLTDFLHDKKLLLILDNCEHEIAACAELAEALLHACPGVRLLATSPEGLNIPGETQWRVPPMAAGDAERLFVERAQAVQPSFALTEQNRTAVTRICQHLDGIPLAIELAAARVQAFTVEQILGHLDDRFQLLTGGSRTAPPRHRTLRAMVDWSYDLLTAKERTLLCQMSVFAGGWTLEAAEAVYGGLGLLELLGQLVSKSLVQLDESVPSQPRYRMLETVRQYAVEKLQAAGETEYEHARERHRLHFAEFTRIAGTHWGAPEQKAWLDRTEMELDNLRVALDWSIHYPADQATEQLLEWMMHLWESRGTYIHEGLAWLEQIFPPGAPIPDETRMKASCAAGYLEVDLYNFRRTRQWLTEAAALADQLKDTQSACRIRVVLCHVIVDHEEALAMYREVMQLALQTGYKPELAGAIGGMGMRMRVMGNYAEAAIALESSLKKCTEIQSRWQINYCMGQQGMLAFVQGDYARARALFLESIEYAQQIGDSYLEAEYQTDLAATAAYQGDYTVASATLESAIMAHYRMGNIFPIAECLGIYAHIAYDRQQWEPSVRLLGAAGEIWRDYPPEYLWREPVLHQEYQRLPPLLRAQLPPERFDKAWDEGQRLTLLQAIDAAREIFRSRAACTRARIASLGSPERASESFS